MKKRIQGILNNRLALLQVLEKLSVAQYNFIPSGFNNNIIWQLGHLLITGDEMLYQNMPAMKPFYESDMSQYGRGGKPAELVTISEIDWLRASLIKSIEDYLYLMDSDNAEQKSAGTRPERFIPISEEWLGFLAFHEAMHTQRINSLLHKMITLEAAEA